MEAVAKHDFKATASDELSFQRGDVLKIINCEDDANWFKAELNGEEGMVPNNYIEMKPNDWFVGRMTRMEAENLLLRKNAGQFIQPDGAFLVRNSESTPNEFSMSVKWNGGVQHFKILRNAEGKYFLWVAVFNSINELVENHRIYSVSRGHTICLKDMHSPEKKVICQAMYDFTPQEEGELKLKKNDEVTKDERVDQHWWRGTNKRTGQTGLYPANYVKEL